ncbi:MAG: pseudouridine synthase [Alphaproteobacteria bacterium]|nr:pseudouridine synthase [Alphaproteobacteria bacterium]
MKTKETKTARAVVPSPDGTERMADKNTSRQTTFKGERLAKVLARAGLCSRRDAERWIEAGRVSVDGKKITSPALNVEDHQKIIVDGKPLPRKDVARLWRYYKPVGLITTAKDPQGRPTVFEYLPDELPRVVSVGRLDLNSEGLLLLTNDGELARYLEKPSEGWSRCYRVRVRVGRNGIDEEELKSLEAGITVEGVKYGSIKAELDTTKGSNAWVTMELKEGKNREIRKIMEHLGYEVNRLLRVSFGPFQLGRLEKNEVEEIPQRVLKDHLAAFFKPKK